LSPRAPPLDTGQLASNRSFPSHPPVGGGPWTSHSGGCGSARSTPSKAPPRECHPGPQSTIGLSVEGPAPRPTGPAHGPKETSQLAGTESPHIRRIPPSKGQMGLSSPPLDRSPAGQDSSQLACVCPRHIVYRRASPVPFHVASMPSLAIACHPSEAPRARTPANWPASAPASRRPENLPACHLSAPSMAIEPTG
jgi:hypothetical protein